MQSKRLMRVDLTATFFSLLTACQHTPLARAEPGLGRVVYRRESLLLIAPASTRTSPYQPLSVDAALRLRRTHEAPEPEPRPRRHVRAAARRGRLWREPVGKRAGTVASRARSRASAVASRARSGASAVASRAQSGASAVAYTAALTLGPRGCARVLSRGSPSDPRRRKPRACLAPCG